MNYSNYARAVQRSLPNSFLLFFLSRLAHVNIHFLYADILNGLCIHKFLIRMKNEDLHAKPLSKSLDE